MSDKRLKLTKDDYFNLPAYYWDTKINTKKNRKKHHNRIPKKFQYKQRKGD